MQDPYKTLGVEREASDAEIKAAFRRQAVRLHPDKNPDDPDAHRRFTELSLAYEILTDPDRRRAFNQSGSADFAPGVPPQGFKNVADLLSELFGSFSSRPAESGDIIQSVRLTFSEAALGCERQLKYDRLDHCKSCQGTGAAKGARLVSCETCKGRGKQHVRQAGLPFVLERTCEDCQGRTAVPTAACQECEGRGLTQRHFQATIQIPPGIEPHSQRIVERAGNRVEPQGTPGNLVLKVEVEADPSFDRDGDDILSSLRVPFVTAALGGTLEVQTLRGSTSVSIPAAAQSGSVLRLRGLGIQRPGGKDGDQLVTLRVEIPTELTGHGRELVRQIQTELDESGPTSTPLIAKLKNLFG